jgi:hypothetical protein
MKKSATKITKAQSESTSEPKKNQVKDGPIAVNPVWQSLAFQDMTSTTHVQAKCSEYKNGTAPEIQAKRLCPSCEVGEEAVQPKLSIGSKNDVYEKEADAVADKVMRSPKTETDPPITTELISRSIQRQTSAVSSTGEGIQLKEQGSSAQSSNMLAPVVSSPGPGSTLSMEVRKRIEPVLGANLSKVRVHTDQRSQQAAQQINARAFTNKTNIFVGRGESANDTKLMAHESTHVVQQSKSSLTPDINKSTALKEGGENLKISESEQDIQRATYVMQDGVGNLYLSVPFNGETAEMHFYLSSDLNAYFESNSSLAQNIEDDLDRIFNPEHGLHESRAFMDSPAVTQQVQTGMRKLVQQGSYDFSVLEQFLNGRTSLYYEQALLSDAGDALAAHYEVDSVAINWDTLIPQLKSLHAVAVSTTAFEESENNRLGYLLDVLEIENSELGEFVGANPVTAQEAYDFFKQYSINKGSEIYTDDVFDYQSDAFLDEYTNLFETIEYVPDDFDLESFRPIEDTTEIDARRDEIITNFIDNEAESRAVMFILDRWTDSAQSPEDYLTGLNVDDLRDDITSKWAEDLMQVARQDDVMMGLIRNRALDEARFIMVAWISAYAQGQEDYNLDLWERFGSAPITDLSEREYAIASDPFTYYNTSNQIAGILKNLLNSLSPDQAIEHDVLQASIDLVAAMELPEIYASLFLLPELLAYLGALQTAMDEQEEATKLALQSQLDLDFEDIAEVVRNYVEHAETFVREEWIPLLKEIALERAAENLAELQYMDANWETVQSHRNIEFARGATELYYLADELESGRAEELEYDGQRIGPDAVEHLRNAAKLLTAAGIENRDEDKQEEKREKIQGVIEDYAEIIADISDGTYDPLDYSSAVYQEARRRLGIVRTMPATVGMVLSRVATTENNPFIDFAVVRWKFKEGLERSFRRGMALVGLGILTLAAALIPGALGVVLGVIDAGLSIYSGVRGVIDAQTTLRMARLDIHGSIVGVSEEAAERALTHAWIGLGVSVVVTLGVGALQARMHFRRAGGVRDPRVAGRVRVTSGESSLLRQTESIHGSNLTRSQVAGEANVVARGNSRPSSMRGYQEEVHLPNNHTWRRNGTTWCRFSIRPFCMPSHTLPRGLRRRAYRDVARTLDHADGIPNRGHSYSDHGAQTTPAQQEHRLRTGTTPGGRTPASGPPGAAGRFNTHRDHLDAYQRALDYLGDNYMKANGSRPKLEVTHTVDMGRGVGTSYSLGTGPRATAALESQTVGRVHFVFKTDGHGWYDLITMYPVP